MKRKIKKIINIFMVLTILFSQISLPVRVLAETLEESYDLNLTIDDAYKLTIESVGTKSFVDVEDYLIKVETSFTYNDGGSYSTSDSYYQINNGLEIEGNLDIALNALETLYNGTYKAKVTIYDTKDIAYTGDFSDASYEAYITDNTLTEEIFKEGEKIINSHKSGIDWTITSELLCDNDVCTLDSTAANKVVSLDFVINEGDLNPDKDYFLNEIINDTYTDTNVDISLTRQINFADLLYGTYVFEYQYRTLEDVVYTRTLTITYGDKTLNPNIVTYFDLTSSLTDEKKLALIYSYTSLTEEERELVSAEYMLLPYNYYDYDIDAALNTNGIGMRFRYFTGIESGIEYSPLAVSSFYGKIQTTDVVTTVGDLLDIVPKVDFVEVVVLNKDRTIADPTSSIETGMIFRLNSYGVIREYPIHLIGDFDGSLVTEADVRELINFAIQTNKNIYPGMLVSDINGDSFIDLKDVTEMIYSINQRAWGVSAYSFTDNLRVGLTNNDIIRVGDEFEVAYSVEGFINDSINGIAGTLNYDKTALELLSISVVNSTTYEWYGNINYDNGNFIYATNSELDTDSVILLFKFKALREADTNVEIKNVEVAKDGVLATLADTSTSIDLDILRALHTNNNLSSLISSIGSINFNREILEYNLYVTSSNYKISFEGTLEDEYATVTGLKEYSLFNDKTIVTIDVTAENGDVKTYTVNIIKVYPKSGNNNLASIVIDDIDIDFNPNILEYDITVENDVNSLDLTIVTEDKKAEVTIVGNENFVTGENIVKIMVTAENGNTKTYTINVTKEEEKLAKADLDGKNNTTEKIIVIVLIALVVTGLLYLIFKKEDEPISRQIPNKK